MTNTIDAITDSLTFAYIGFGLRSAMAEGLTIDADKFGGEHAFLSELIAFAPALHEEWELRYGEQGVSPGQAPFHFQYEIAEEFGKQYGALLAKDPKADAQPLIQQIFDDADPDFEAPDMEAIREAIIEDTLDSLARSDSYASDVVRNGLTGVDKMSRRDLVRFYGELFDEPLPLLADRASDEGPENPAEPAAAVAAA